MIVFTDIETTGLDPNRHAITEIAMIREDKEELVAWIELNEQELKVAESVALKINGYYERVEESSFIPAKDVISTDKSEWTNPRQELADRIARLTAGCVLAGNNIKFDQQFLEVWLRKHGACPVWDYHVLDVPTFAAGVAQARGHRLDPPYKSGKVSKVFDVSEPDVVHTARGDAVWSKQLYERAMSWEPLN